MNIQLQSDQFLSYEYLTGSEKWKHRQCLTFDQENSKSYLKNPKILNEKNKIKKHFQNLTMRESKTLWPLWLLHVAYYEI